VVGGLNGATTLRADGLSAEILGIGGHTYHAGEGPEGFCTRDQRANLIQSLVAGGVNYFDTTWMNEVELLADSIRRADIGEPLQVALQYVDGISDPHGRQNRRREMETRLQVMGYDCAPLFLMGVGNGSPPVSEIESACKGMQALKEEGLIQNIGLSCREAVRFHAHALHHSL